MTNEEWQNYEARIMAKLQPENVRTTLAFAALFQVVHELIKHLVLDNVKGFYQFGTEDEYNDRQYREKVLSRDPKSRFRASLLWLIDSQAITQEQADRLGTIFAHRHDLTHELLKYLIDPDSDPDVSLLTEALDILVSLHRFWAQIEIDVGSFEHIGDRVTADEVQPGWGPLLWLCVQALTPEGQGATQEG